MKYNSSRMIVMVVMIIAAMLALCPLMLRAQSNGSLTTMWKEYDTLEKKDLPQSCLKLLDKISKKSESEKNYASLLKSEMKILNISYELAPDSMTTVRSKLKTKITALKGKDKVAYAIFNLAAYCAGYKMETPIQRSYLEEAFADMDILANTKADDWSYIVDKQAGSEAFSHDLLSIMGYQAREFKRLYDYYKTKGNRRACALLAQYSEVTGGEKNLTPYVEEYKDLPEGAYLAKLYLSSVHSTDKYYDLLQSYRKQWAGTKEGKMFENIERDEERAFVHLSSVPGIVPINKEQEISVESKNVKKVRLVLIPLNVKARDIPRNTLSDIKKYYNSLLTKYATKDGNGYKGQKVIEKNFDIKNYYTPEKSNITLPALKGGVYLMQLESCDERDSRSYKDPNGFELNTNQSKAFDQDLLYVSNLKILRLALGNKKYRQVVVDSETGHEVKEAVIVKDKDNSMAAYTADDNGMPYGYMRGGSFYFNKPERENNEVNLFLDRGVYRPGQTVHVAAIAHTVKDGLQTEVAANQKITLSLVDANWQNVEERDFTTDEYGTVSAEFTIPTDRLTGRWTIRVRGFGSSDVRFRVEEYKRPSFEVTFKKYEQDYKLGDTIKVVGVAKTYAGVPVANAKVICEVKRERPMWCWWHCSSYGIQLAKDTVQTDDNGEFIMDVPLAYPIDERLDGNDIVCYYYKVTADVTSMAGETQQGETGLVASNKPLMLKVAIKDKILKKEDTRLEVTVRNNAGEVQKDAVTTLKIAGIDKKFATVDEANAAIKQLASGKYKLIAEARKNDAVATDTAEFVVFTLDDRKPVIDTLQWSYITHSQFKDKDDVITVQFGSSAEDVEVFYDVFVGEEHTESSVLHVSNSLIRKDFKAVEGENILVTYAWVKKGVLYQQQHCLWKAVPKKTLNLTWKTFRNKLLPGQKEEWTLTVDNPNDKKKTGVQMLACMFDKSLEAIAPNYWQMRLGMNTGTSYSEWTANSHGNASLHLYRIFKSVKEEHPVFSKFNIWPFKWWYRTFADEDYDVVEAEVNNEVAVVSSYKSVAKSRAAAPMAMSKLEGRISGISGVNSEAAEEKVYDVVEESARFAPNSDNGSEAEGIEMRSNFAETAFFYPQLMTDDKGNVAIKFTLPESTTTWKFRALAHDKAMNNGMLEDEIIAQKQLMISPNMPRFIRKGDKNVLASIVSNMSDKVLETKTTIEILDPETERVLYSQSVNNTIEGGKTAAVNFDIAPEDIAKGNSADAEAIGSLYIIKVYTQAGGMSDGEQRYLAIIDNVEPVMTTKAITMIKPGKETINTAELFPTDATERKLTVEWTENPAWLMLETLPYMQNQDQTTSYSQAAAFYANALGSSILKAMPENVKRQIQQPINVEENKSALEKNAELKTLLLNETPWVVDAKNETERIQMLKNFYDENKLAYNQQQIIRKLKDEQNSDGGWSWCSGMQTSYWITSEICELFVRLNNMIGKQEATSTLLKNAMKCLQKKAHEEVEQWRKSEKKGNDVYIYDCYALQYVYLKALGGEKLTGTDKADADFIIKYLKKQERKNSLFMKAKLAVVLHYMGEESIAKEYVQSINEYSAYKELDGRYFDTRRAGYSWRDYKQPTQTMVIEALKTITPENQQTIAEYQRWLLLQKRNQMWDTPINTVNNVYAFVSPSRTGGNENLINAFGTDGKGYSKTTYVEKNIQPQVDFEKTNDKVSWGALYAQFKQKASNVSDFSQGLKITRQIISSDGNETPTPKVGDKVKVRLTIEADRDYDFVQIVDKRAACLEPVNQLSQYHYGGTRTLDQVIYSGYYEAPQDSRTCYYFDMLRKGKCVLETEYYIDRVGDYQSGTCTVQCAYAPEFYGRTGGIVIKVE